MNRESLKAAFGIFIMYIALTGVSLATLWVGSAFAVGWINLLIWCWGNGALAFSVFACAHVGAIWTLAVEASTRKAQAVERGEP